MVEKTYSSPLPPYPIQSFLYFPAQKGREFSYAKAVDFPTQGASNHCGPTMPSPENSYCAVPRGAYVATQAAHYLTASASHCFVLAIVWP